ncbi:MAG: polysaccharide pyruvyl transferase family protein [Rhodobacteraceae bacterium]|nr:polysaccharide pyruvyl transferase family protein [Paracoccaceae bacterium]
MNQTPKIGAFFFLKTKFDNIGDALINQQLISIAAETAPVVVDRSLAPDVFVRNLGLQTSDRVTIIRSGMLGLALQMIRLRFAGGRPIMFLTPGGNSKEKSLKLYLVNELFTAFLALLWLCGVRFLAIGSSYETLGARYRRLARHRLALASRVYVRDRRSRAELASAGIVVDGILPDLAFGLEFDTPQIAQVPPVIGFSFRADEPHYSEELIALGVRQVLDRHPQSPVKFVAQVATDLPFMHRLFEDAKAGHGGAVSFVDLTTSLWAFRAQAYGDCAVLFSNRLHALLLGLAAGATPVACLHPTHDMKIRGVFEEFGLSGSLFDLNAEGLPPMDWVRLAPSKTTMSRIHQAGQELRDGISRAMHAVAGQEG